MFRRLKNLLPKFGEWMKNLAGNLRTSRDCRTSVGVDAKKFEDCMNGGKGSKYAPAIRQSIARMQQLGVGGTPLVLIGLTPPPGTPMKVISFVYGAKPYPEFKAAIDAALAQAR